MLRTVKFPLLLLCLILSVSLSAQEDLPRVAVFPFNVPAGDPGVANLSQAATDTLVLTLQLLGKYEIVRGTLPSPLESDEVFNSLRGEFIDYAVYGAIEPGTEGGYRITAYSWENASDTVTLGVEMDAMSAFDLFDSMDLATVRFAEDFTGIHIGFGRLVFKNSTPGESYIVEIDGNTVGPDVAKREVLYGRRRISIFLPPMEPGETRYHLVSYLLNIEEGEEYSIPFSIDPGLDRNDWNAAFKPSVELDGSRVITSLPRDGRIFIGNEILGRTPLIADPIFVSPGETLLIERDYFLPLTLSTADQDIQFDLSVDPANPFIKPALNRVWLGAATNVLITATQVFFVMLPGMEGKFDEGPPAWPLMLAASPRFGYMLAGDIKTAGILSLASLLSAGIILGASELEMMDNDLSMILWQLPFWTTLIYDIAGSPFKAASDNRKKLAGIKADGLPELNERKRSWISKPYTALQVGGGAYAMAGFGIDMLKEYFAFDMYAGISGDYFEPFKPIPSVNTKALFFPAVSFNLAVQPYAGAVLHLALNTDEFDLAGAVGPALGFEIPVPEIWIMPKMTLFFEAEYYFSPVGAFPMIGMGAKLK